MLVSMLTLPQNTAVQLHRSAREAADSSLVSSGSLSAGWHHLSLPTQTDITIPKMFHMSIF